MSMMKSQANCYMKYLSFKRIQTLKKLLNDGEWSRTTRWMNLPRFSFSKKEKKSFLNTQRNIEVRKMCFYVLGQRAYHRMFFRSLIGFMSSLFCSLEDQMMLIEVDAMIWGVIWGVVINSQAKKGAGSIIKQHFKYFNSSLRNSLDCATFFSRINFSQRILSMILIINDQNKSC